MRPNNKCNVTDKRESFAEISILTDRGLWWSLVEGWGSVENKFETIGINTRIPTSL